MRNTNTIIRRAAAALAAAALAACTQDILPEEQNAEMQPAAESGIYVGGADAATTRAFPAIQGDCKADTVNIRVFRTEQDNEDHTYTAGDFWMDSEDFPDDNNIFADLKPWYNSGADVDEWRVGKIKLTTGTTIIYDKIQFEKSRYNDGQYPWVGLEHKRTNALITSALAYTNEDAKYFTRTPAAVHLKFLDDYVTLTPQDDGKYCSAGKTVRKKYRVPELFSGQIGLDGGNKHFDYGYFYTYGYKYDDASGKQLTNYGGILLRAVSQLRVHLLNVPSDVAGMELYATHFPIRMGLAGKHGGSVFTEFKYESTPRQHQTEPYLHSSLSCYRVRAAQDAATDCAADSVSVCQIDITNRWQTVAMVQCDTYMLPSEVGVTLTLRVWYKGGIHAGKYKDYKVQPQNSAVLTGENAHYHVEHSELVAKRDADGNPSELYVYNSTNGCFYSYANVRVTLTAEFGDIAQGEGEAAFGIILEPGFVQRHNYEAK